MATITSFKYGKIIYESKLVHSGSPTVYQLTPKKENTGRLKRLTLGEKDPKKSNKTILLVGETGTGKSTLINVLVNYAMGVTWEDDVWFQMVEDEKRSQSESQTSAVMVYQIFGFEGITLPYSLTIIDTPGYGDTRGIEHDDVIKEKLLDLFRSEDGVHEINAVGLVLKASENRLSDRLRYVFDSVMSLFGKDLEKYIVVLITHSDGITPKNALKTLEMAKVKCAKDEKNQPVHFLFDNCQHLDRTEEKLYLQHKEEITTEGMKQFSLFLGRTKPQTLKTTLDVLNERIRLTACIQKKHRHQWLEESFQHVVKLKQIALNAVSLATRVHLDFLIEKMKEKGDAEKVQKLEEMRCQVDKDEGSRDALRYLGGHQSS